MKISVCVQAYFLLKWKHGSKEGESESLLSKISLVLFFIQNFLAFETIISIN